jgi:glycosyltransferase involved in cell wall biosynthesis
VKASVVIPTNGRGPVDRVVAALGDVEVIVVADAAAPDVPAATLRAERPGASAARNAGWRAASGDVVLFLGDDIVAAPGLVEAHLARHRADPAADAAVVGLVVWARDVRVTAFMRWLERGVQFEFGGITGEEAGWGRFYTSNASVKRAALEACGGFDEVAFPFHYEDLDLARRAGLRVLWAPEAIGEHVHAQTLESQRERLRAIAPAEQRFVERYPDVRPHFHDALLPALDYRQGRGWGARLAGFVPERVPVLGPAVWRRADLWWRQQLATAYQSGQTSR